MILGENAPPHSGSIPLIASFLAIGSDQLINCRIHAAKQEKFQKISGQIPERIFPSQGDSVLQTASSICYHMNMQSLPISLQKRDLALLRGLFECRVMPNTSQRFILTASQKPPRSAK